MKKYVSLVLLLGFVVLPTIFAENDVGDTATDFTLLSNEGDMKSLYDYFGKIIVLNFGAFWCVNCKLEAPLLEQNIWQPYKDRGVQVLSVITENASFEPPTLRDLQDWANDFGCTFPILGDDGTVFPRYEQGPLPMNLVIDQCMIIRYKKDGYEEDEIIAWIESLLNNTPAPTPPPETPTATPPPTESPSTPTVTPASEITLAFDISRTYFRPGNDFFLNGIANNQGEQLDLDLYVALDVFGDYYFYPAWTHDLQFEPKPVPPGTRSWTLIPPFSWPAVEGSLSGIQFWGILTLPGTYELASTVAHTSFGYGP